MKKGFTLVELLIVMVIIGTLVTVALPKYQSALERGRALEGLRNVQYAAEYVNAKALATGHWLSDSNADDKKELDAFKRTDMVKSKFFALPSVSGTVVSIRREGADWKYQLTAHSTNDGDIEWIRCESRAGESTNDCEKLDMPEGVNLMTRK